MNLSIEDLKKICQKKVEATDGYFISQIRKISIYFTKYFITINVSPNVASFLSIFLFVFAVLIILFDDYWISKLSILLLILSQIFDCVDGELARYYGNLNYGGIFIENFSHYFSTSFLFICFSYKSYLETFNSLSFLLGFIIIMSYYLKIVTVLLYKSFNLTRIQNERPTNKKSKSNPIFRLIWNFPVSLILVLVAEITNNYFLILFIVSILMPIVFGRQILVWYNIFKNYSCEVGDNIES